MPLKNQTKIWNNSVHTLESTEHKQDQPHSNPSILPGMIKNHIFNDKVETQKEYRRFLALEVRWVRSTGKPSQLEVARWSPRKKGLHRHTTVKIPRGPLMRLLRVSQQNASSDQLALKHTHSWSTSALPLHRKTTGRGENSFHLHLDLLVPLFIFLFS